MNILSYSVHVTLEEPNIKCLLNSNNFIIIIIIIIIIIQNFHMFVKFLKLLVYVHARVYSFCDHNWFRMLWVIFEMNLLEQVMEYSTVGALVSIWTDAGNCNFVFDKWEDEMSELSG